MEETEEMMEPAKQQKKWSKEQQRKKLGIPPQFTELMGLWDTL